MNRGKRCNTEFPTGLADRLDAVCDRFEEAWRAGEEVCEVSGGGHAQ